MRAPQTYSIPVTAVCTANVPECPRVVPLLAFGAVRQLAFGVVPVLQPNTRCILELLDIVGDNHQALRTSVPSDHFVIGADRPTHFLQLCSELPSVS